MSATTCPCCSGKQFSLCCEPYIKGTAKAPTAEALMRSRYSAYAVHNANYLYKTTAPKMRKYHSKAALLGWAKSNQWVKLEIVKATETVVEFNAYYLDSQLKAQMHHEISTFVQENENWYYLDGEY
jgi:SEC-C motif-containing protein